MLVIAAVVASEALALAAAPFVRLTALKTLLLLTFPFTLAAAIGLWVIGRALGRRRTDAPARAAGTAPRKAAASGALAATAAAMVAWLGLYAANCATIYGPFDVETYVIYAIAGLAAVLLFRGLRRLVGSGALPAAVRITERQGRAILTLVLGALALATDLFVFPSGYFRLHEVFWAAGGLLIVAAAMSALALPRAQYLAGACALLVAVQLQVAGRGTTTAADGRYLALGSLISHRAFMQTVWRLSDRDGDGFSALAGGSDCDDGDPRAYPLSREGRDCTGLRPAALETAPATTWPPRPPQAGGASGTAVEGGRAARPRVILLITIDAFRCGFGLSDDPDLRDACPELARLGRQGRLRLDAHTTAPQTRWAIGSLLTGSYPPFLPGSAPMTGSSLPRRLSRLGYRTLALPTCQYAAIAAGVDQFDEVDPSLIPVARNGAAISAPEVNRAVLGRVAAARAPGGRPLFLWTHYLDPHAPYLRDADTRWVVSWRRNYVAEIRRTDAALGALLRALATRPGDPLEVLVFVTADHGEELGEHGLAFHGAQVYEESIRVPMLAWSTGLAQGGAARQALPGALPGSLAQVADYLEAAVTGGGFVPSPVAMSWAPLTGTVSIVAGPRKIVFFPGLGFHQIFDLDHDPKERVDLANVSQPMSIEPLSRDLLTLAPWLPALRPPGL